jgi:hypothetical protein
MPRRPLDYGRMADPLAKRTPVVLVDPGHPPVQPINDILAPSDHDVITLAALLYPWLNTV